MKTIYLNLITVFEFCFIVGIQKNVLLLFCFMFNSELALVNYIVISNKI